MTENLLLIPTQQTYSKSEWLETDFWFYFYILRVLSSLSSCSVMILLVTYLFIYDIENQNQKKNNNSMNIIIHVISILCTHKYCIIYLYLIQPIHKLHRVQCNWKENAENFTFFFLLTQQKMRSKLITHTIHVCSILHFIFFFPFAARFNFKRNICT